MQNNDHSSNLSELDVIDQLQNAFEIQTNYRLHGIEDEEFFKQLILSDKSQFDYAKSADLEVYSCCCWIMKMR